MTLGLAPLFARKVLADDQGKTQRGNDAAEEGQPEAKLRRWFDDALSETGAQPVDVPKPLKKPVLTWVDAETSSNAGLGALGAAPLGAAGGGGGGGGGGGVSSVSQPAVASAGTVVKGYLTQAVVWRDLNNNGRFDWVDNNRNGRIDAGEVTADAFAISDAQGKFAELAGRGPIRVFGGVDLYGTGLDFKGQLLAPDGAKVVTPITTLIELIRQPAENAEQAALKLKALLALPNAATPQDLLSIDPIAEALSQSDKASLGLALYADSTKIANYLLAATGWLGQAYKLSGLSLSGSEANEAVLAATASVLSRSTSFSFERSADLSLALKTLALTTPTSVDWSKVVDAGVLAQALSSIAARFGDIVANASSAKQALVGLAQTEYLIQNDLLLALEQSPGAFPASSFQGSGLDKRLAEIAEVVGPVTGPADGQRGLAGRPYTDETTASNLGPGQLLLDENDLSLKTISFKVKLSNASAQLGDRLLLLIEPKVLGTHIINASDLSAGVATIELESAMFRGLAENQLFRLTARIDTADGVPGLMSRALQVFVDTAVPTPLVTLISEDTKNPNDGVSYMPPVFAIKQVEKGALFEIEIFREGQSLGSVGLLQSTDFSTSLEGLLSQLPLPQTLAEGSYRLSLIQSDLAGHRSPPVDVSVLLDQTAPRIEVDNQSLIVDPQASAVIRLPVSVDEKVTWMADIINLPAAETLKLEVKDGALLGDLKTLKDGDYRLRLIAEDLAGNADFTELDLVIDRTLKAASAEHTKLDKLNAVMPNSGPDNSPLAPKATWLDGLSALQARSEGLNFFDHQAMDRELAEQIQWSNSLKV